MIPLERCCLDFLEIWCWRICKELLNHFSFHLDQAVLMTTWIQINMHHCMYFECYSLNIYQSEKYFEQRL
jgi:hypothetical protein